MGRKYHVWVNELSRSCDEQPGSQVWLPGGDGRGGSRLCPRLHSERVRHIRVSPLHQSGRAWRCWIFHVGNSVQRDSHPVLREEKSIGNGYSSMWLRCREYRVLDALRLGTCVVTGVGSIVFSPLSKLLIDEFGWRGTLLIEGALVLHCVPCGLVMRPILTGRRKKVNIETERIIPDRFGVKQSLLQNGIDLEVVQTNSESSTTLNISNEAKLLQINTTTSELNGNATSSLQEQVTVTKDISPNEERLLYRKWILKFRDLFHVELLKNGAFLIMILSYLCEGLAYSVPFTFLPDMTVTLGYSRQQASWLLSTVAIANTVSRIPIGMIADIRCVNRLYVYIAGLTGVGVCICLIAFAKAYILLICICVFYGVFIGCYVVLLPLVLADLFGDDRIADTKGLTCFTNGIAGLIGLPIAGALFDISGQYTLTFMMSAVGYMLAGFVLLFTNRCKWS